MRLGLALVVLLCLLASARADEAGLAALQAGGHVAVIRHALTTPGVGDPRGFRLEDCATQRNLTEEGREEARALGRLLRERNVRVDRVLASEWCRAAETAALLGAGPVGKEPALNDLYGRPQNRAPQVEALRALIAAWQGRGTLLLVTHGSVTGALMGVNPGTAEGVVLAPAPGSADGFRAVGRISPRG